jgi:hypothetical protein
MPRIVPSQVVALIDQMFPGAASEVGGQGRGSINNAQAACLEALIDLVEQIPGELIILDGAQYGALAVSMAFVRSATEIFRARGGAAFALDNPPGFEDLSAVALIRRVLSRCPDEYPSAGTSELSFIQPNDLRESLRQDISAVNRALANGEWKAATVLAGSVVEALLLWALQPCRPEDIETAIHALMENKTLLKNPGKVLDRWDLHDYIEVAAALNLINEETASQARLAKDFRNLIHPGRAVRLRQECNRATALSAVAAVEHVVRNLTPR